MKEKWSLIFLMSALAVFLTMLKAFPQTTNSFQVRDLSSITNRWINAISYSPYRNGQSPEIGVYPKYEQVREDLNILKKNWGLIRIYAADPAAETILSVIQKEKIGLKVFLGAWICQFRNVNDSQVSNVVRLARQYRDIIPAVIVGNEALVKWSDHQVSYDDMVQAIRTVRDAVSQPVSVADNYEFWLTPEAKTIVDEIDFITIHNYPLWDQRSIGEAMAYTKAYYQSIRRKFPDRFSIYGEVGWATQSDNSYMQTGQANESNQTVYYKKVVDWASNNNVTAFFFDAFDETWKKSTSNGPRDPEKHWGLFTADRLSKPAISNVYPELIAVANATNGK
jgi:exo-beta-1,3-glucanase (GH17 family)